jgi:hypothetical protein
MQSFFDESNSRYAEKVKANQENGKRGGRPKRGYFDQGKETGKISILPVSVLGGLLLD